MNKYELRTELVQLNDSLNLIDSQLLKAKVAYHNLEKLGYEVKDFYDMIDNMGISFSQLKTKSRDFIKQQIKEISKEE